MDEGGELGGTTGTAYLLGDLVAVSKRDGLGRVGLMSVERFPC